MCTSSLTTRLREQGSQKLCWPGEQVTMMTARLAPRGGGSRLVDRPSLLISLSLLLLLATTVGAADQPIRCAGWGGGKQVRTLPASAINDGYCDCPHDGTDEPDTGACAGSVDGGWAGIPAASSDEG